jgi:hypothetical protein
MVSKVFTIRVLALQRYRTHKSGKQRLSAQIRPARDNLIDGGCRQRLTNRERHAQRPRHGLWFAAI